MVEQDNTHNPNASPYPVPAISTHLILYNGQYFPTAPVTVSVRARYTSKEASEFYNEQVRIPILLPGECIEREFITHGSVVEIDAA